MNYLPTCTSRLVVQHPCQVSFKSMQGCRMSWEDKLKCVKILSVKDHNSAKICRTWIISPHALLDLWCNIPAKFHSIPCKDVGGVEKTNFDATEWRNDERTERRKDGMTEWRNDGRTDKANTKCLLAISWRGHKKKKNRDILWYSFRIAIRYKFFVYCDIPIYRYIVIPLLKTSINFDINILPKGITDAQRFSQGNWELYHRRTKVQ